MNKKPKTIRTVISTVIVLVISIFVAATFYWTTPIADIEKASPNAWFGAALLAGMISGMISEKHFAITGVLVASGFALAIILRIFYDISFVDKTSHNLFPIEVVMWTIMAAIPAIAGTFIGSMLSRLAQKVFNKIKKS